jgi:ferredoxin
MSLPVSQMVARGDMADTECILCGTCADNCKGGAIRYAFGRRSRIGAKVTIKK